jgi:LysM repeat protein
MAIGVAACGGDSDDPEPTPTPTVEAVEGEQSPGVEETPTTPAGVDDTPTQPGEQTHTVQPGETLGVIAQQYGVTIDLIVAANDIENPDLIFPGQVLTIPDTSAGDPSLPGDEDEDDAPPTEGDGNGE